MAFDNEPPELGRLHDTSILWRVSAWGGAATVALAAAVLITQTDVGAARLKLAFSGWDEPARSIAKTEQTSRATPESDTQRLEAQVRALTADRDRLAARIASLENSVNDMTGSIKRELALVAATAPSPPPKPSRPQTTSSPARVATMTASTDSVSPTAAPVQTGQGQTDIQSEAKFESKIDTQPQAGPEPQPDASIETSKTAPELQSQAAVPATESVPLPPVRVATATASEPAPRKPDLAVDLGGAHTMAILNARWLAVKANFGPMLEGMHPLYVQDRRPGAVPFRLIVGPLPNGAAAAQICARFAASRVTCRTTKFIGEQLVQQ